jgi:hypothetical protein
MRIRPVWVTVLAVPLVIGSCSRNAGADKYPPLVTHPMSRDSMFEITASIRELMDATVDPAADRLWESVAIVTTSAGTDRRQPNTDEEWQAVRRSAITLMESMNLVVLEGRPAAAPGTRAGEGELTPAEIDQQIATNRAAFIALAHALRGVTQKALTAVNKRDAGALMDAGGEIDEACEACHLVFWYPNQTKPAI